MKEKVQKRGLLTQNAHSERCPLCSQGKRGHAYRRQHHQHPQRRHCPSQLSEQAQKRYERGCDQVLPCSCLSFSSFVVLGSVPQHPHCSPHPRCCATRLECSVVVLMMYINRVASGERRRHSQLSEMKTRRPGCGGGMKREERRELERGEEGGGEEEDEG